MKTNREKIKTGARNRRRIRIRTKVTGTANRPRCSVFRSNTHIYAQLIDDTTGTTLASVKDTDVKSKGTKTDIAFEVGKLLAKKAQEKKITAIVFDRGGYAYHGRVKAVAEGMREAGLTF